MKALHRFARLKQVKTPTGFASGATRRQFSSSQSRPIMELAGFSHEQLMVREAVSQTCSQFPNTYWQTCDQEGRDPSEFHAAIADGGWLGIALPESFGGSGLGKYHIISHHQAPSLILKLT